MRQGSGDRQIAGSGNILSLNYIAIAAAHVRPIIALWRASVLAHNPRVLPAAWPQRYPLLALSESAAG